MYIGVSGGGRERQFQVFCMTDREKQTAVQTFRIFIDGILELGRLNLETGEYNVVKRDKQLPEDAGDCDFTAHCERLAESGKLHPDDIAEFREQLVLSAIREKVYHAKDSVFYRYRILMSEGFTWITIEVIPDAGCPADNTWAAVLVREDKLTNQLMRERDFIYSHDSLTGLFNRNKYEEDLQNLPFTGIRFISCIYIDVIGLHEINNYTGHHSGDVMLCCVADAARFYFGTEFIYRIGGDEFVILCPELHTQSCTEAIAQMREALMKQDYEISVGVSETDNLFELREMINDAEEVMRKEKVQYYKQTGNKRQLRILNQKLEQILTEKRDIEHFLRIIAPRYVAVCAVNLETDEMRMITMPDAFKVLTKKSDGTFRDMMQIYLEKQVAPLYRESFDKVMDYSWLRARLEAAEPAECLYVKKNGSLRRLKIFPYSEKHPEDAWTLWIFADEEAVPVCS